jgi:hypothetical protein
VETFEVDLILFVKLNVVFESIPEGLEFLSSLKSKFVLLEDIFQFLLRQKAISILVKHCEQILNRLHRS